MYILLLTAKNKKQDLLTALEAGADDYLMTPFNDTLGHLEGDTVLRETAQKLRSSIRIYDSVGRYGGEEFLIVLPECDLRQTREKAEQFRVLIGSELAGNPQRSLTVTVSMGVTAGTGDKDTKSVLHAADNALYRAKRKGRNRVEYNLIDDALEDDGFNRKHPLILIVDDEHAHRELLAEYLEQERFCVAMAASGREAVEQARELHPDLITLDILMPGRGGFETLVDLKSASETANIPVIVISSIDKAKVDFKPNAEEYLAKPVGKLLFIAAVQRYVARALGT